MHKSTFAGTVLLAMLLGVGWRWSIRDRRTAPVAPVGRMDQPAPATGARRARPPEPPVPPTLTAAEKAARIDQIKRDYDEICAKASADYGAAGAAFPGGLNAFLQQLALLEREKRADFANVLSPRELEDLEMRESAAGQLVDRLLGPTTATTEQRRTVFQLQRNYENKFALTYDLTPRALYERETARQQTQEQIHAVLGDDVFGSWLRGEGEEYALGVAFASRHGLAPNVPLELRALKNEFTLRRLEIAAQPGSPPEQLRATRDALTRQFEARAISLIGTAALQAGRNDVLSWLPKTK
ncbi:MAG: hypothetical protein EXS37_07120 [Opitutus sp.]|nr:hypothetical protein [Opitutus sp.]